jgi:hypothetical protein
MNSILQQFKDNLVSFLDELIDVFPSESELILLRIFIKDQIPTEDILNKFIYTINKNDNEIRNYIKQRNDIVFTNADFFQAITQIKTMNFRKLWVSDLLDENEKEMFWKWIESFVSLSDKYITKKNEL